MKKSVFVAGCLFLGLAIGVVSCKKEELTPTNSDYLSVEKKNASFIVKHTGTWCAPCGGWGFTQFQTYIDNFGDTEVLAASVSGSMGIGNNETIFGMFADTLDITSTPTFHMNLGQDVNASSINAHRDSADVKVNSNYSLSIDGTNMKIKTTTEFFEASSGVEYYITPYIIVDGIVANQEGHPDGANTVHKKSLMDVAKIPGVEETNYFGYKFAAGEIEKGYKVNLEFESTFNTAWGAENVSIALVITTKDANGDPVFVNAYTKH